MSERLDIELVIRDLARSRTQAGALITAGRVTVNGKEVLKSSHKISPDDKVEVSEGIDFVSRAGHKLAHALNEFSIKPGGLCVDVGASTGGFTQVLLENGTLGMALGLSLRIEASAGSRPIKKGRVSTSIR